MVSPEENRTPSVSPPSSPTHQDSSLSAFLENLSPLNPDPQPVLLSPRVDQQQEMTFRDGIDGAGFNFFGYGDDTPLESQPMRSSETGFTGHQDTTDHQSNMSPAPFSGGYYYHQNFLQQAADGQVGGGSYQLFPQPLHSTPAYANFAESSRSALRGPARGTDQHQRSIRRHLQFGVPGNDNLNLSLTGGPIKLENYVEPSWISSNHLQAPTFLPSFYPSQSFGSAQIQNIGYNYISMSNLTPSVEHLYRSTLAGYEANASDSTARRILAYNLQAQQNQLPSMNSQNYLDNSSFSIIPRKMYAHTIDNLQQNNPAAIIGSYEGLTSENPSQEPSRKKAKSSKDGDDTRKCSCKRSKCVKLYCECFTAGIYCLDICGCVECFNRPDYEDTVIDAKEHVESRNPLAFGSKVYKHAPHSPSNELEEGNLATPSSARHKRGCNCKKSKCAKKYCECFQNGVGCSNGCRCDNCDNFFGKRKGDSRGPIYRRIENLDNTTHERLNTLEDQDAGRSSQLSATREEPADMSHRNRLALYHSGMVATSASQGGTLQSSAGNLHGCLSPSILTPKSYGTTVLPEVKSESLPYTPTVAVKLSSPDSPPRNQSQELMSSSSQGLLSRRRFTLPVVPPFPPLTPDIKSKDETQQTDGANNEDDSESHSEDEEDADDSHGDNNEDASDSHGDNK